MNAVLKIPNTAAPEPADVRGKSLLDKVPVQNHPGPRVSCAGLKVPAAAIPKLSVSCSSLSQSCCPSFYSPRAPFSASLVPEVPAKATLVQGRPAASGLSPVFLFHP